ncbi:MAG: phosphoglycerate dehydrogenase [bacterium]
MKILVSDPISDKGVEIFKKAKIDVDVKTKLTPEELKNIIGDYDGLIVRSQTKVTKDIIEAGKKLKIIGRAGVGIDNVDVPSATKKGIIVMNTPGGNTISAAEHTLSLMLALSRNIPQAHSSLKAGEWKRKEFTGTEVMGKTLGIIGLGRIGAEVAKRAVGFGMNIVAYDPFVTVEYVQRLGAKLVPTTEDVFKVADYITLHIPVTDETKYLINKKTIASMKDGVRIINCARGAIVNTKDLAEAVKSGKVKGAALDVFEKEPPPADDPVFSLPNIIVTPHLGASTEEAQVNVAIDIAKQVVDAITGKVVRNAVNMPSVDPEVLKEIKPYLELAEKIGKLAGQLGKGRTNEVTLEYSGEVSQYDVGPISTALVKGLLEPVIGEDVNYVNATFIANERGIKIVESKSSQLEDFANLVTVKLKGDKGELVIGGTLFGKRDKRIVFIDDFYLDAIPEGYMLICSNLDKPGVIGYLGTVLGKNKINIAAMQVGRKKSVAGEALTVISIDNDVPKDVLSEIKKYKDITDIQLVRL